MWFWTKTVMVTSVVLLVVAWAIYLGAEDYSRSQNASYLDGYEAGLSGVPVQACPCPGEDASSSWKNGWIKGFKERKSCP